MSTKQFLKKRRKSSEKGEKLQQNNQRPIQLSGTWSNQTLFNFKKSKLSNKGIKVFIKNKKLKREILKLKTDDGNISHDRREILKTTEQFQQNLNESQTLKPPILLSTRTTGEKLKIKSYLAQTQKTLEKHCSK